jgi:DNA mismatch repair protein MutS
MHCGKKTGWTTYFFKKNNTRRADDSYGIEVAKLAGVKNEVIKRAKEIVDSLENTNKTNDIVSMKQRKPEAKKTENDNQIGLFGIDAIEIRDKLKISTRIPDTFEALKLLYNLKLKADKNLKDFKAGTT